jgi:hypothetical protein
MRTLLLTLVLAPVVFYAALLGWFKIQDRWS